MFGSKAGLVLEASVIGFILEISRIFYSHFKLHFCTASHIVYHLAAFIFGSRFPC